IGTGDESTFTLLRDDDVIQPVHGAQGGTMVPIRLRFTGTATPGCVAQSTVLSQDGRSFAIEHTPVKTYAQADGTFLTRPDYAVFFEQPVYGLPIVVSIDAGTKSVQVRVWLGSRGVGDLGATD